MTRLLRMALLSGFLLAAAGCAWHLVPPDMPQQCGTALGVDGVRNQTRYHEYGPLLEDALIDAINTSAGVVYRRDADCRVLCELRDYRESVERRDAEGNILDLRPGFQLQCQIQHGDTLVRQTPERWYEYRDFVSRDIRSAWQHAADQVLQELVGSDAERQP